MDRSLRMRKKESVEIKKIIILKWRNNQQNVACSDKNNRNYEVETSALFLEHKNGVKKMFIAVLDEWLRHLTGNRIPFGSICATVRYCPIDRPKKKKRRK